MYGLDDFRWRREARGLQRTQRIDVPDDDEPGAPYRARRARVQYSRMASTRARCCPLDASATRSRNGRSRSLTLGAVQRSLTRGVRRRMHCASARAQAAAAHKEWASDSRLGQCSGSRCIRSSSVRTRWRTGLTTAGATWRTLSRSPDTAHGERIDGESVGAQRECCARGRQSRQRR